MGGSRIPPARFLQINNKGSNMKRIEIISVFFLLSGCNLQQQSMEGEQSAVGFLQQISSDQQIKTVSSQTVSKVSAKVSKKASLDFKKMADENIDFDQNTEFDETDAFTWLYNHHQRIINREQNKVLKINKKMGKLHDQLERIRVDRAVAEEEITIKGYQDKINLLERELESLDKWLAESIQNMDQHYYYMDIAFEMAQTEKNFVDLHLQNKNYLALEGNKGFKTDSAQELLEDHPQYSISLWFRTVDQQKQNVLLLINEETTDGFIEVGVFEEGVYVRELAKDQVVNEIRGESAYASNDWQHLCLTVDGDNLSLYLNGVIQGKAAFKVQNYGLLPTYFGSFKNRERFFSGDIDEVSLWSKSLSEKEINHLYNQSIPEDLSVGTQIDYLVKWWRMGDKTPKSVSGDYY